MFLCHLLNDLAASALMYFGDLQTLQLLFYAFAYSILVLRPSIPLAAIEFAFFLFLFAYLFVHLYQISKLILEIHLKQ